MRVSHSAFYPKRASKSSVLGQVMLEGQRDITSAPDCWEQEIRVIFELWMDFVTFLGKRKKSNFGVAQVVSPGGGWFTEVRF